MHRGERQAFLSAIPMTLAALPFRLIARIALLVFRLIRFILSDPKGDDSP